MANVYQSQYAKIAIRALNTDSASYALTASYAMNGGSGGGSTDTGSLLKTASAAGNTITFTKGDGSTFPVTVAGGTGAPGGSDTQLQFNSASVFSGSSNLRFNYTNNTIYLTGSISASSGANTVGFFGTASWAQSASNALFAQTASFITASNVWGPFGSSSVLSASYASGSTSASYAETASYALASDPYPINIIGSTLYSLGLAASGIPSSNNTINSIFFGTGSGFNATNASQSNFLGANAGTYAASANNSNFIGNNAGTYAVNANNSTFIGNIAGTNATNANNSNFIGTGAGINATNANNSNFLGQAAGGTATNASQSNFLGYQTGYGAISASYSTLIGYQVGFAPTTDLSIGPNNIIVGTNITLAPQRKNSINIGGIIFGTGSYSTTAGTPFTGSADGKIGINTEIPNYNLQVSGTVAFPNLTDSNTATKVVLLDSNGQLFTTASSAIGGGGGSGGNFVPSSWTGSNASVFAGTASYVTGSIFTSTNPALSASYALTASAVSVTNEPFPNTPVVRYLTYVYATASNQSLIVTGSLTYNHQTNTIFATASQALTASYFSGFTSTSSFLGNGLSSSFNINHGFNTLNLHITVYSASGTYENVYPDIRRINANTASIIFANPPTANQYIVYISQ